MSAPAVTASFEYTRPASLGTAIDLLQRPGAVALAGGTDLVMMRAAGTVRPELVVDLKHVAALTVVECTRDTLRIGACVRMAELALRRDTGCEALADGAALVGAQQTRERATLGGNVCRSSPAGDTLAALLVLDAQAVIDGPQCERTVPVRDFFTGPGTNVLRAGELLTALELPLVTGTASAYQRLTYRQTMDLAVIGVAAAVQMDDGICSSARLAGAAVAPTPILFEAAAHELVGTDATGDPLRRACDAVVAEARPITDVRGTAEYRAQMLRVLTERAVRQAIDRAQVAEAPA